MFSGDGSHSQEVAGILCQSILVQKKKKERRGRWRHKWVGVELRFYFQRCASCFHSVKENYSVFITCFDIKQGVDVWSD